MSKVRIEVLRAFEKQHRIKLPEAYVSYLTHIGNGGGDRGVGHRSEAS